MYVQYAHAKHMPYVYLQNGYTRQNNTLTVEALCCFTADVAKWIRALYIRLSDWFGVLVQQV